MGDDPMILKTLRVENDFPFHCQYLQLDEVKIVLFFIRYLILPADLLNVNQLVGVIITPKNEMEIT